MNSVVLPTRYQITLSLAVSFMLSNAGLLFAVQNQPPEKKSEIDFEKHIKPIFEKHCISCHGPEQAKSKFRVDRRESFLKGGDYGEPMIVPGKSAKSRLIPIIEKTDDDLSMPPNWGFVPKKDVAILKQWIDEGAKMPETDAEKNDKPPVVLKSDHWSLQTIKPTRPPTNKNDQWVKNEIDAFVLQKLEQNQLNPSRQAARPTLIRRLYLVMLGVPPTPEEVDRFVKSRDPDAWPKLVDQVLQDPRYGERWAQHWLDIVRFGETDGYETNRERPNAWKYRDWVIHAFNSDKPYDRFVKEQIAGDAFGEPIGTGFLVAGPYDIVKSPDINLTLMQRQDELADFVHTSGTAFLGLTIGCARCHDHKFDPITQTDYYAMQAIFAGVQHGERNVPPDLNQSERIAELAARMAVSDRKLAEWIQPNTDPLTFIDDRSSYVAGKTGITFLVPPAGVGMNPEGDAAGHRDHVGSNQTFANISGGGYTWWKNQPGKDVAVYRPRLRGKYRVWISWGSGHATHSKDAQYILDKDGSTSTQNDQQRLARINQQQPAMHQKSQPGQPLPEKHLWSGFFSLGEHDMTPTAILLLRGGETGTAITADTVIFERVDANAKAATRVRFGSFRPPPRSELTIESFESFESDTIRFVIDQTNGAEPCIDEWEIYSNGKNIALETSGQVQSVTSSGNFQGNPKHQLKHINDGVVGNSRSWISNSATHSWVQIHFRKPHKIDRMKWSRDRDQKFKDRTPTVYRFQYRTPEGDWKSFADSRSRLPANYLQPKTVAFKAANPADQRELDSLKTQLAKDLAEQKTLLQPTKAYIGIFNAKPPTIHRLHRGDPMSKREVVQPNTVRVIGDLKLGAPASEQRRRVALAEWIADSKNPLTSRVIVNRLWQYHFGKGIVSTASDFGLNGTKPTHPELLDWMASELVASRWSLKSIHRKILLSATWQQDSRPNAAAIKKDAGTQWYWRFPIRRLEAESIRDSIVSVSGVMNPRRGGPGFSAFEVQLENVRHYFPKKHYGEDDWRRMIYMTKIRQEKESTFGAFDCPDGSQVIPNRSRSTTPLQALNLFNSRFMLQQAELFAARLNRETAEAELDGTPPIFFKVRRAFRLCYGRNPSARELAISREFIDNHDLVQFCRAMLNSNEFIFIP